MIPILFNKDEKTFTSLGLGQMDATLVEVERERNGNYTLYAEVRFNSPQAKHLTKEMLIKADAGSRTKWQTFKINRTIKDTNADVIKVYADHISMDTINDAMKPKVVIRQQTAEGALTQWANSLVSGKTYDVQSDITHVGSTEWTIDEVENARQALGGVSGSILDVWGGEYEFDNNRIILHKEMGRTAPTVLEYGRNIVSLEYEELIDGVYTSIYPYATYTPKSEDNKQLPDVMVTLDELIVDSEYAGNYETRRIQIVDFSNEFDSNAENPEIPTQDKLRTLAKAYVKNNGYGIPKISQEIDFVDLSKTLDYQDIQVMEEIELNDRVPVYYPNIDAETNDVKVTTTNWDVLNNRYSKITLSTIGAMNSNSITSKLNTAIKDLKAEQKKINNTVPYLINGQGNRVWHTTPDDNMEHKLGDTWFKKNGKYTIIYKWNGSMWEEVLNDETFITEIEAEVANAKEEAEKASQSAKGADTRAVTAIEKAGANANLLTTHQETLDTIQNTTIPNVNKVATDAMAEAKSALNSASSAMTEAQKADGKIASYVNQKGLVSGTTVDSKINTATGEISKKITTVESKIPTQIGGRNLIPQSDFNSGIVTGGSGSKDGFQFNGVTYSNDNGEFRVTFPTKGIDTSVRFVFWSSTNKLNLQKGDKITLSFKGRTDSENNLCIRTGGTFPSPVTKIPMTSSDGIYTVTFEAPLSITNVAIVFWLENAGVTVFDWMKLEAGDVRTDWSPAPEDNYTQEEFKIFESTYNEDVKGIRSSLTDLSNKKLDGATYTTFYNNEYKSTAQGVTDTYTKLNKIIDSNGNSTDTFAKAVYDRNAERQKLDFNNVTKDLVTTATYTAGINGVTESITSVRGDLDNLKVGGRNYLTGTSNEWASITSGMWWTPLYNRLALTNIEGKVGDSFTASVNLKPTGGKAVFVRLTIYNPNSSSLGYRVVTGNEIASGKEGISTVTTEIIEGDTHIEVGVQHQNSGTTTTTFNYKELQLEKGTVRSDWSQAPEEKLGQADFTVFKNDYEKNDKTVKSRLTAIDSGKEGSILYNTNEALSTAKGNTSSISTLDTKVDNLRVGGRNYFKNSDIERTGSREFVNHATWDMSPLFDEFGTDTYYTVSFDIKSKVAGNINVYAQNGNGTKYGIGTKTINVPTTYKRFSYTFKPSLSNSNETMSLLAFYGTYNTGRIPTVKNVKLEVGNFATDWTPAPEDMLGKADFTVFKNDYNETAKSVERRLTAIDSSEEGSVVTRLNKTEKTAGENSTAITKVNNIVTIQDTRSTNQPPRWYRANYPTTTVQEFKSVTTIRDSNIPSTSGFGILTTTIVWANTSGGTVQQVFSKDSSRYTRRGWTDDTGWMPWRKMTDQEDIKNFVDSTSTEYQTIKERSNLYERVIGSSSEADVKQKMSRIVMTDRAFQTEVIDRQNLLTGMASGTGMTSDPYFDKGANGIGVYDNGRTGTITIRRTKIPSTTAIPAPKGNDGYRLDIIHGASSATSPNRGGIIKVTNGWVNGTVVVKFVALLPTGRSFSYHNNALGNGYTAGWLTDNKGTGKWETYMYYYRFGSSGAMSNFGHLSVTGASSAFTWYLTEYDIINVTETTASKITQLADNINLKVSANKLISEINVQAGGVLIQSGTNKLNITPTTTYIQDGTIESAKIKSLDAGKITAGTLDAGKVKVVNLDANNITSGTLKSINIINTINYLENGRTYTGDMAIAGGYISSYVSGGSGYYKSIRLSDRNIRISNQDASMDMQAGKVTFDGTLTGGGQIWYQDNLARLVAGSYNGFALATYRNGAFSNRLSVGGWTGEDLAPFVDVHATMNMRYQKIENLNGLFMRTDESKTGAVMYPTSDNNLALGGTWGTVIGHLGSDGKTVYEFLKADQASDRVRFAKNINMQGNTILNQSDERLKHNICKLERDDLSILKDIKYKSFTFNNQNKETFGFIAQDIQKIMPSLIMQETDGYLSYDSMEYTHLIGHALQQHVTEVDDEITQLKTQIESLKEELATLKGA